MFIVLIRTIFLYFLVILVMRLMGKRQIGELQPYEFVITIMISDLAALPMQDTRLPLILGIIPIITLLFIKTILTQLQLKSQFTRKILEGEPCILVCKGKINYQALKRQQINLDELMEELRLAGYFDLNEIQYAILENNGQLSFLTWQSSSGGGSCNTSCDSNTQPLSSGSPDSPSSQSNSSCSQNTNSNASGSESSSKNNKKSNPSSSTSSESSSNSGNSSSAQPPILPIIYVLDGHVNKNALTTSGKNKYWIEHELKKHHINSIKDVLIAMIDTQGQFVYQLYDKNEKEKGAKKMKNSLFSIFLFVLLLGFLTYADISFKNLCSDVIEMCDKMEETLDYSTKEENFKDAMEIFNLIQDKGKIAAIYINHVDYDVMLNEALKLTVYIEKDDSSEAEASLHLLKYSTEHMKELQVPKMENIF